MQVPPWVDHRRAMLQACPIRLQWFLAVHMFGYVCKHVLEHTTSFKGLQQSIEAKQEAASIIMPVQINHFFK